MTNWIDLTVLKDNLIVYFIGSNIGFAIAVFIVSLLIFIALGFDMRYSFALSFPLAASFYLAGYLQTATADYSWIINLGLIILGLTFGLIMYRMFTNATN